MDLEGVTMTLASCRQPNDTTGPTFKYGLHALHPRSRRTSAWTMGIAETQISGIQTDPCSQYTQLTRATHETIVYLHDIPCGTPRDKTEWPAKVVPAHLRTRLARMNDHRDLAGDYECSPWTATGRVHPNQYL